MIKKLVQAAIVAACGLALGGCPLEQTKTTAPANRPPAADYQAAVPPSPPARGSWRPFRSARIGCVLILLPPSEGKFAPSEGAPVDLDSLAFAAEPGELVIDMRSAAYAAAWKPRRATLLAVRAFSESNGARKPVSHMA